MNKSYINSKPQRDVHRCSWCGNDSLLIDYHDNEWAKPVTNDYLLFEYLILEIFQAGLSWRTILAKEKTFDMPSQSLTSRRFQTIRKTI